MGHRHHGGACRFWERLDGMVGLEARDAYGVEDHDVSGVEGC